MHLSIAGSRLEHGHAVHIHVPTSLTAMNGRLVNSVSTTGSGGRSSDYKHDVGAETTVTADASSVPHSASAIDVLPLHTSSSGRRKRVSVVTACPLLQPRGLTCTHNNVAGNRTKRMATHCCNQRPQRPSFYVHHTYTQGTAHTLRPQCVLALSS